MLVKEKYWIYKKNTLKEYRTKKEKPYLKFIGSFLYQRYIEQCSFKTAGAICVEQWLTRRTIYTGLFICSREAGWDFNKGLLKVVDLGPKAALFYKI